MVEISITSFPLEKNDFLAVIYNALSEAILGVDLNSGRILHCNEAAATLLCRSVEEILSGTTELIIADQRIFQSFLSDVRKHGNGKTLGQIGRDGTYRSIELTATHVRPPAMDGQYVVLVLRGENPQDKRPELEELQSRNARLSELINERTKLIQLQRDIAVLANEASSIEDALELTMEKICKETSFPCPETSLLVGHVHRMMTTDPNSRTNYWYLSHPEQLTPFRTLSESIRFDYGLGLIGRVLVSRKLEWLADFSGDPTDPRANAAKDAGLKTAIAFPVLAGQDIVAVMEILTSEMLAPEAPLLDALSQIGIELGRIVERKRTEERLRQNQLLATIGLTAAKLAHEISNPLNGMYTATQLLEQACKDPKISADDAVPSTVKDLKKEIERLRNLLYDFRLLSKPINFDFELSDVAAIAREVAALEGPRYAQQGITVELDFPSDLPKAHLDREKIKQALLNLCQNAADSMPRGGRLTIRGYKLWEALCVEVCDTGAGLPERMNIFEIFTTTKRGGTGLGLPIVQQIVSGHQGSVTYASEPGKGTIFRLTLPTKPQK
jgi:signal transduction histidine kinase